MHRVWRRLSRRCGTVSRRPPVCRERRLVSGRSVWAFRSTKAMAETLVNGWLKTGDVGVEDEEGYFSIVDRLKDMVNSAGLKIWPREVEEVIYRLSAVSECAVVGRPDPVFGESVVACIVVRAGESLDEDEVVSFCKEHIASYKAPK